MRVIANVGRRSIVGTAAGLQRRGRYGALAPSARGVSRLQRSAARQLGAAPR